tara:strand:+ start:4917 stop:5060 length:144 start_codon:yes stop_codon:yes gene_type:complete
MMFLLYTGVEFFYWRVGRVDEGARLESVYAAMSCIVGSNPTLSDYSS